MWLGKSPPPASRSRASGTNGVAGASLARRRLRHLRNRSRAKPERRKQEQKYQQSERNQRAPIPEDRPSTHRGVCLSTGQERQEEIPPSPVLGARRPPTTKSHPPRARIAGTEVHLNPARFLAVDAAELHGASPFARVAPTAFAAGAVYPTRKLHLELTP